VVRFELDSPHLGEPSTVRVLLPTRVEPGQTLRTLYVLPVEGGVGGPHGDGLAVVRDADAHNRYGLICVSMSFDTVPWYGAHAEDPKIRHEAFIKEALVPAIEQRFPATGEPSDRLLLGFSKSGWGAVSLLLRSPDFFGSACAWDAPLMMTEDDLKWGSRRHFGTPEQAAGYVPLSLVPKAAAALAEGPPRLAVFGRDLFGRHTRQFHALLEKHGIPHRYDAALRFKHRWDSGWVPVALERWLGDPAASDPATRPPATRATAGEVAA